MDGDRRREHTAGEISARKQLVSLLDARQDRMLYTYRTQEKAADRYAHRESVRKATTIVLTALTSGTLMTAIAGLLLNEVWGNFAVAALATLATLAAFLGDFLDFAGKAKAHQEAATKLRAIHNSYESLINDLASSAITLEEARQSRDRLQQQEEALLLGVARTTRRDYECAYKAIDGDEKPSSSQAEIDSRTPGRIPSNHDEEDNR